MSPDAGPGDPAASGAGSNLDTPDGVRRRASGGLLLLRAGASRAREWARDGLGPVVVIPDPSGWTVVVPHGGRTFAAAPFDDGVGAVLGRPVRRRLLPTIGVALVGTRLAISVVPAVLRPARVWLVWEPGSGLVRPPGLAPATVAQLVAAADRREHRDVAASMLADGRGSAGRVLNDIFEVLGLPGADLATGARAPLNEPGAVLVEPSREDVGRFDRTVHEVRRWREEVEGSS